MIYDYISIKQKNMQYKQQKNIRLELYSTCISVLKNFGVFFRPPPKLPNFVKFGRNFAEILNSGLMCSKLLLAYAYSTRQSSFGFPNQASAQDASKLQQFSILSGQIPNHRVPAVMIPYGQWLLLRVNHESPLFTYLPSSYDDHTFNLLHHNFIQRCHSLDTEM